MNNKTRILMQEMTWPEYANRIKEDILILPVGSLEQHGPHLPMGTDAIQVAELAFRAAEQVEAIVAPCLYYGYRSAPKSGGGEIFPGTTSLQGKTLIDLICDVLHAFIRHGAKKIVVLDGHFENAMFLHEAIHLTMTGPFIDSDAKVIKLGIGDLITIEALGNAFPEGFSFPGLSLEHAAHLETSTMLALHPDLVVKKEIRKDGARDLPPYDIYPQPVDLMPKSGVLADPSLATAEIGQMLIETSLKQFVLILRNAFK